MIHVIKALFSRIKKTTAVLIPHFQYFGQTVIKSVV